MDINYYPSSSEMYNELASKGNIVDTFILLDPGNNITPETIKLMWVYFRITDPISRENYPDVEHLQEDFSRITQELIDKYQEIYERFRTIWEDFIKHPRALIEFFGFPNKKMISFFKNESSFKILYLNLEHEQTVQWLTNFFFRTYLYSGRIVVVRLKIYD